MREEEGLLEGDWSSVAVERRGAAAQEGSENGGERRREQSTGYLPGI
jgi:hypothetical protein